MSLVDWEAVVLDVLTQVRTKNSHGQRELTDFISDSIARHRLPEGVTEMAGRVIVPALIEELSRPSARTEAAGRGADGEPARPFVAT